MKEEEKLEAPFCEGGIGRTIFQRFFELKGGLWRGSKWMAPNDLAKSEVLVDSEGK